MMKVIESLLKSLRNAAVHNPEIQVAPACILWPDRDRQWEAVVPRLQVELPELFVLGDYVPDKKRGPAIWLRCVIGGQIHEISIPKGSTPVLYLPGVSRQDLRAVESCPDFLKPLAELQYRGLVWSQINAKDWTILAYLKSDQGGLGLDVAQDNDAKNAMQMALYRLLDEEVELLKGKRLDKDYFNTLLTGGDPIRDVLQWLDQGDDFKLSRGENEWKAFVEVSKSHLGFNPQKEGVLAGAAKLATHVGSWQVIWDRFCEAPKRYTNIPGRIRQCQPPAFDLFTDEKSAGGWPQWNVEQEDVLRLELQALGNFPPHEARVKLLEIEKQHGRRRSLVWAELGEAPLARAIEHLAVVAEVTKTNLAAGTIDDLAAGYQTNGWKADDAVVQALAQVEKNLDVEVVSKAIHALYLSWAEESARYLQKVWEPKHRWVPAKYDAGEMDCVVFVDGLRFDCAKRLKLMLEQKGLTVEEKASWAALPSVTGTGKPAVAPIHIQSDRFAEEPDGGNFELVPSYQLRKIIGENGYAVTEKKSSVYPPPSDVPKLWCEFGDIDHEGHARGWKLARHLDTLLLEIRDQVIALIHLGWNRIRIVTDHGWLLLPQGLPKIELSSVLIDEKWGRCASLKSGAATDERLYPWYWNPHQYFALADGISCFKSGEEYAHGGLSLQECLTLELTVNNPSSSQASISLDITDIVWKGLRCTVAIEGDAVAFSLDIRRDAGDASTSVVVNVKHFNDSGTASVVVKDEDIEGRSAMVVLLDAQGSLVAQTATVIGG